MHFLCQIYFNYGVGSYKEQKVGVLRKPFSAVDFTASEPIWSCWEPFWFDNFRPPILVLRWPMFTVPI